MKNNDALTKINASIWKPPPHGHFKLNFDGASCGNLGLTGVGLMIFDHHANFVQARCHAIGHKSKNFVEFNALSLGLDMAISLGIKDLVIEGDSMVTIQCVMKKKSNYWKLQYVLDLILQQLAFFDSFLITHCFREINRIADFLANLAIDSNANLRDINME